MLRLCSCILLQKQEGAMAKKYIINLAEDERAQLLALTKRGKVSARRLSRAHIVLQADTGLSEDAIAQALHIGTRRQWNASASALSKTASRRP
jgi:hypothetical protein